MPRHPLSTKTRLIISAETPKSDRIRTGTPAAMASRAAVEDTVTNPPAVDSAPAMDPVLNRTAPAATLPSATSSAQSSG